MLDVVVVGDGPAGLSAALLLSKNELDVEVFGENETRLHAAYLYNYPGIKAIDGSEFVRIVREQCEEFGAVIRTDRVVSVTVANDGFRTTTASDETSDSNYLVLAVGKRHELAEAMGMEFDQGEFSNEDSFRSAFESRSVAVDRNGRTSVENAYAGVWTTDWEKVQAAIAVGDGGANRYRHPLTRGGGSGSGLRRTTVVNSASGIRLVLPNDDPSGTFGVYALGREQNSN